MGIIFFMCYFYKMDLKELNSGIDQNTHWYYQTKKKPLLSFVEKIVNKEKNLNILDIGSGSGFFSYEIAEQFGDKVGDVIQCDIGYSEEDINECIGTRIKRIVNLPDSISNSIIIMMDVLEHIENDKKFLEEIVNRCTGNNNYFFITVPAFENIWSGHDVYLGHYRRYTVESLASLLADQEIYSVHYIFGSLYPAAYLKRKLTGGNNTEAKSDMKPVFSLANNILIKYFTLENSIFSNNRLFGLTCVAKGKLKK
jgi:2-polyprenyl-3-methyl-5-hydroxy-6-metoxy-1,4-benzoquinol methylase